MAGEFKKRLKRYKQCEKCPWKKSVNPYDIPNGYCPTKHRGLSGTIAKEANQFDFKIVAMACHESKNNNPYYCVGWLHNQLGDGNNIPLRIEMLKYNLKPLQVIGDQHERFEDTLPK